MIRCGEPQIGLKEREYVTQVLDAGQLTQGPWVERFAHELGSRFFAPDGLVIPVSSGTAALHVALLACGVGRGDEVIVPATTFVATMNAVLYCGAKPVIVDVSPRTWTVNRDEVAARITKKTKAIVPVHLYGVPADLCLDIVLDVHRRTGRLIMVVEDCAEALGAWTCSRPVGSLGDAAAFSFYGSKTITTGGEGGAVVTGDFYVAQRAAHLQGQAHTSQRYVHDTVGFNYRMTELQAAFGVAQLERFDEMMRRRQDVFRWYDARLPEEFRRQALVQGDAHGLWAFAVYKPCGPGGPMDARKVERQMLAAGVETRPIFPPVSSFPHAPPQSSVPLYAQSLHNHGLVLPTHAGLTEEDVDKVCHALREAASCS